MNYARIYLLLLSFLVVPLSGCELETELYPSDQEQSSQEENTNPEAPADPPAEAPPADDPPKDDPPVDEDPSPAPPITSRPNEPAGFIKITERDFDRRNENGWTDNDGRNNGEIRSTFSIIQDPTAPHSPNGVGAVVYPKGFSGGGRSSIMSRIGYRIGTPSQLYISFYFKLSKNWFGHTGASTNKVFYVGHPIFINVHGSGTNRLHFRISQQGGEHKNLTWNDSENLVRPTSDQAQIERGKWHHIEVLLNLNTPGVRNGEVHAWVDGVKTHHFRDRMILASPSKGQYSEIGFLDWHPIYGGQNGVDVPETQYQYMDHIYVSGRP